jgi:hypothetical protein
LSQNVTFLKAKILNYKEITFEINIVIHDVSDENEQLYKVDLSRYNL